MIRIEARDVSCSYGTRPVLESLSLSVRAGEVLVLLGPNGAGKTTLLRALARLLRPSRGSVLLNDQGIWTQGPGEVARCVALMPQSERRDCPLTVEEAVSLGRAPHRGWFLPFTNEDRQIVEQVLQKTALGDLRNRLVSELSGGESKRVILARALAQQAQVLLLDEPTSGLDLKFQVEVLQLVRELASQEGLAVVLTMHDLNLSALYGHRLALLSNRAMVACGAPEAVLTAELIERVFGVAVMVIPHPVYATPTVVPIAHTPLKQTLLNGLAADPAAKA